MGREGIVQHVELAQDDRIGRSVGARLADRRERVGIRERSAVGEIGVGPPPFRLGRRGGVQLPPCERELDLERLQPRLEVRDELVGSHVAETRGRVRRSHRSISEPRRR